MTSSPGSASESDRFGDENVSRETKRFLMFIHSWCIEQES